MTDKNKINEKDAGRLLSLWEERRLPEQEDREVSDALLSFLDEDFPDVYSPEEADTLSNILSDHIHNLAEDEKRLRRKRLTALIMSAAASLLIIIGGIAVYNMENLDGQDKLLAEVSQYNSSAQDSAGPEYADTSATVNNSQATAAGYPANIADNSLSSSGKRIQSTPSIMGDERKTNSKNKYNRPQKILTKQNDAPAALSSDATELVDALEDIGSSLDNLFAEAFDNGHLSVDPGAQSMEVFSSTLSEVLSEMKDMNVTIRF